MKFKNKKQKQDFFKKNCLPENRKFRIEYENFFLKQLKKYIKTEKDVLLICEIIKKLSLTGDLNEKTYKAHYLHGKLKGFKEAHIKDDLLIIWKPEKERIIITAIGTHSSLFD